MLEILMATALVGFGILTMIGVYASGIQMMGQNRDQAVALDLARSVIVGARELGLPGVPGRWCSPASPPSRTSLPGPTTSAT